MFGGGAVTFEIEPPRGTINDINKRLMDFYKVVRDGPKELVQENARHKSDHDYYYKARQRFNEGNGKLSPVERASLLLYLNRTCFNGLYRENRRGEFNVPYGRYKNPDFIQEQAIQEASVILDRLEILNTDVRYIVKKAKKGDIVYLDPPYCPLSTTSSFTSYYKDDFGFSEQQRLKTIVTELDEKGVFIVLSNSSSAQIRQLYEGISGFRISDILARRAINCNGQRRGEVGEIIVTNIPERD